MTEKKTEAKAEKKLSDSERIDAILELLEKNGITLPKALK